MITGYCSTPRTGSAQESDSEMSSDEEMSLPSPIRGSAEPRRNDTNAAYPLPMPAYGGYFAPLSEYLPDSLHPSAGFHRYTDSNQGVRFSCL